VRQIFRRSGLRGRLLIALVATSALTLAVAAAALLPPLQDRLRTQRVDDLQAATEADVPQFEQVLGKALRDTAKDPENVRRTELLLDTQSRATLLRQRTGARVVVTDSIPERVYDTDTASALPAGLLYRAIIDGDNVRAVSGSTVTVIAQLFPIPAPGRLTESHPEYERFLLITQRPLTDVDAAVDQVRTAFIAAAGIGLIVAVVLGIALSTTLSRRLARLRAAAVRVAAEGPDAPAPRDRGRDEVGDLARTLAAMQEALRRQEAARRAFVATASHELRTPLTSLQGTLELLGEDLRDGRLDTHDAQQQIAGAQSQLRRLGRLATELLDLSRLDAAVPMRSEPVELGELCRAVVAEFELQARDRGVEIRVEPPPGPCWAAGDPGAVARVVRILVDNALRYSPAGEAVRVVPAYHGVHATVEVSDRGPGVDEHDRELIFERFHRGSAQSGSGGFGLGLAIGRELAERMGGSLGLRDPGQDAAGARFVLALRIELPAGSHHADERDEPAAPQPQATTPR
jgi:signal transduction histidine kinase